MGEKYRSYAANMEYTADLKINGKKFHASGSTAREALANLKLPPRTVSAAILTVSRGKTSKDRVLSPRQVTRMINPSPLIREVNLKSLSLLFDGV